MQDAREILRFAELKCSDKYLMDRALVGDIRAKRALELRELMRNPTKQTAENLKEYSSIIENMGSDLSRDYPKEY